MTLPVALHPFNSFRQFITYRVEPHPTIPGKLIKRPTDWRNGRVSDAHDPAIHTDYDTAAEHGPVGFVFTDLDPFWFLDIDDCLTPTGWSPLALELCAALPGAAVEVSISGKGLHIYGAGPLPRHKTKNVALGLELYHTARFAAIGTGAIGDAMIDHSAAMADIVARYFSGASEEDTPDDWSVGPVPEWRGPVDDDELIRRACASKSMSAAFGGRASFAQLWDADPVALAGAYPAEGRDYDASSADAALAQHLAFWTGKNCERMTVLMWKSNLKREKWDDHTSYIKRTVTQAVAKQIDVCKDKAPEVLQPMTLGVRDVVGETFIQPEGMKILFYGCTYVQDSHTILMLDGSMLNEGRFNVSMGGYTYVLDRANSKTAKTPWEAFTQSRDVRFPKANFTEFNPTRPESEPWSYEGKTYINSYRRIPTERKKGNPKPFIDHLIKLLPDAGDRAQVLAYMAAVVQHPGVKFQWCPLIQGAEGNGKSLLSRCVAASVGENHTHWPVAKEISEKFNSWIENKIFIGVEDIYIPEERSDVIEVLKPMITGNKLEIRGMGREKVTKAICANFILNSNHKDAIRKTKNDRRFAIFYTAQQSAEDIIKAGMGGSYFPDLYNWLRRDGFAIVADYLQTYAIPAALNPSGDCHRAPVTSSTDEAVTASAGRLEQEIINAIENDHVGFRDGWVSGHYLDLLIKSLSLDAKYPRNRRGQVMIELGYFQHPGLPKGQVNNTVSPDGCKPTLWVTRLHDTWDLRGAEVMRKYSEAQTVAPVFLRAVS